MHQKRLRVYIPVKRFVWIQYDKPASDISVNSRVIIFYCKRNFISFLKRVVHRGACCRILDITGYGCPKFHGSALRGKRGVFIAATGSEPKGTGQQRQQSGQVLYLFHHICLILSFFLCHRQWRNCRLQPYTVHFSGLTHDVRRWLYLFSSLLPGHNRCHRPRRLSSRRFAS